MKIALVSCFAELLQKQELLPSINHKHDGYDPFGIGLETSVTGLVFVLTIATVMVLASYH